MISLRSLFVFLVLSAFTVAHTVITYPGWRGDNLVTNGTVGVDDYSPDTFPYGMQWMYPCGGIGLTSNRTYWPIGGGAVAFQPGWFQGHKTAFMYINLGLGSVPPNYSLIMQPVFQIIGPVNDAYPGSSVCLPQVPLPANVTVNEGDNATIQVVENAKHGAALFSCVDITFTNDMSKVAPINESNCYNDSNIQFSQVFTTSSLSGNAIATFKSAKSIGLMTATALGVAVWILL